MWITSCYMHMYRHIECCLYHIVDNLTVTNTFLWHYYCGIVYPQSLWSRIHENNGPCTENNRYISWELLVIILELENYSNMGQNMRIICLTVINWRICLLIQGRVFLDFVVTRGMQACTISKNLQCHLFQLKLMSSDCREFQSVLLILSFQ